MKIQLPDFVIAGLYKDSIVFVDEPNLISPPQVKNKTEEIEVKHSAPDKKWYLGDNKKNIVFVVNDPSAVFINDEWLSTLGRLLNACKLNLGDIAIINMANTKTVFEEIKERLQPQCLFLFDLNTTSIQLPFAIPHYQVQKYSGCMIMTSPASNLSENSTEYVKAEKRKLWLKLKEIFNV